MKARDAGQARWTGFTLVELLVVIAITAILLGLLLVPLVQGFRLTRQSQIQAQAQETLRLAINQIQNDLKRAAYVLDNANRSVDLPVQRNGQIVFLSLPYAVIDLVPPAYGDPSQPPNDPTSEIPLGQEELAVPVAPGRTVVRYFLGLMDNTVDNQGQVVNPYLNPDEQRLVSATAKENLVVLYRAEFPLYVFRNNQWVLNPDLFDRIEDFYDPRFFYGPKWQGWRKIARPIVPLGSVDMVEVTYDNNGNPVQAIPLFQLKPTQVVNQMGTPVPAGDIESEAGDHPPVKVRFPQGLWQIEPNTFRLVVFRSKPDALQQNQPLQYFFTDFVSTPQTRLWLRWYSSDNAQIVNVADLTETKQEVYRLRSGGSYNTPLDPSQPYLNFHLDEDTGAVNFELPWWLTYEEPMLVFSTGEFYNPFNDPSTSADGTLNRQFNINYRLASNTGTQNNVKRYISLIDRNYDLIIDGTQNDRIPWGDLSRFSASIVPGSEVVIGPDQRPGPNYGKPIRYHRVPSANAPVGPNQYRILYRDLVPIEEVLRMNNGQIVPSLLRGYIEFYSDPQMPLPPGRNNVFVTFWYQLNLPTDTYVADYLTRRLMEASLGVRFYGGQRTVNLNQKVQIELPNLVRVRRED